MSTAIDKTCHVCGIRPTIRTIGSVPYCHECAEAFLEPLRKKHGVRTINRLGDPPNVRHIRLAPDIGPNLWETECLTCGATWVGETDEECGWCIRREERQRDEQRQMLLRPSWLETSEGEPRYEQLSDVDKRIWNRTRGITNRSDNGSVEEWCRRLARAESVGLITDAEARTAMNRVTKRLEK